MFNLLPKAEKEAIRREYRVRLVIVILWFGSATLAAASILLLPSYFLSSLKEKAALRRFDALASSAEGASVAAEAALLESARSKLALLERKAPSAYLYEVLIRMSRVESSGISLSGFSFIKSGAGKHRTDISGVATSRTALLSFVKALEQTSLFESVEVPISNFAKDTDIAFTIQAKGAF